MPIQYWLDNSHYRLPIQNFVVNSAKHANYLKVDRTDVRFPSNNCIFPQEFSKRTEGIAVQAENLVKEATEIPLGAKNKQLLQQQAKSIKEQVKKLEDTLEEEYVLDKP